MFATMASRFHSKTNRKPRPKRCRNPDCRQQFTPARPLQAVCSPACAVVVGRIATAKAAKRAEQVERQQIRKRKQAIKSLSELASDAQEYVNRYVRLRDRAKPCVSCGRPASWQGQWHASHLKSTGSNSALRFNLWNIHKACQPCNHRKGGNIGEYRIRVIDRIGLARLDWLDQHPRSRRYTREYLIRLKQVFARRCRAMEKRIESLHSFTSI